MTAAEEAKKDPAVAQPSRNLEPGIVAASRGGDSVSYRKQHRNGSVGHWTADGDGQGSRPGAGTTIK